MKYFILLCAIVFFGCINSEKDKKLTINSHFRIEELVLKQTTPEEFLFKAKEMNIPFTEEYIEGYENIQTNGPIEICGNDERAEGTRKIFTNDSLQITFVFNLYQDKFVLKKYEIRDFSRFQFNQFNPNHLSLFQYKKQATYFFDEYFQISSEDDHRTIYYKKINDSILKMEYLTVQADF